jgi:hypothetical protein
MQSVRRSRHDGTAFVTTGSASRKTRERTHAIRNEEDAIATRLVQNAHSETSRRERRLSAITRP